MGGCVTVSSSKGVQFSPSILLGDDRAFRYLSIGPFRAAQATSKRTQTM